MSLPADGRGGYLWNCVIYVAFLLSQKNSTSPAQRSDCILSNRPYRAIKELEEDLGEQLFIPTSRSTR